MANGDFWMIGPSDRVAACKTLVDGEITDAPFYHEAFEEDDLSCPDDDDHQAIWDDPYINEVCKPWEESVKQTGFGRSNLPSQHPHAVNLTIKIPKNDPLGDWCHTLICGCTDCLPQAACRSNADHPPLTPN
jgi:hypothetical protein